VKAFMTAFLEIYC